MVYAVATVFGFITLLELIVFAITTIVATADMRHLGREDGKLAVFHAFIDRKALDEGSDTT